MENVMLFHMLASETTLFQLIPLSCKTWFQNLLLAAEIN